MSIIAMPAARAAAPMSGQWLGTLAATDDSGRYHVVCEDGVPRAARLAASCLLQPSHGDTLLVSGTDRHRLYVIAVIEQAEPAQSRISVPGDLDIEARGGTLRMHANDSVATRAGTVSVDAGTLAVRTAEADLHLERARYTGRVLKATVTSLRVVGQMFETIADRLNTVARNALRVVEHTDTVRAGHLDMQAEATARLHGRHAMVTGRDLVKVDAAQIHVG